ncbi:diguanylate cyclase (GGDEF) domain-containing protein [Cryptosporangium arvum DSM 44712]|uniref:Diguanylate cyclase (GGDEF) domain-containing protein n=1 Tax=Cryptosporangium arvum DSM 44712 TaxID=927661 RepID=A0A010YJW1_9ACTN|nr:diguanylate cyclase (GGDEF) domain-containing protein [Cryptosporangium arvum DSM 44712]
MPLFAAACGVPSAIAPGNAWAHGCYLLGFASFVALGWVRLRTISGPARTGYGLILGALSVWLAGDLLYDALSRFVGPPGEVSASDVFWVSGYPLLAIGLVHLVRLRTSGRLREGLLDAMTLATVMAWLCWQFVILPAAENQRLALPVVVGALYPLGDVVLFAVVAILVLAPGSRGGPTRFVVGALTLTLLGDVLISMLPAVFEDLTRAVQADRLDGVLLVANSLFVSAVVHPNAAKIAEPAPAEHQKLHPARVVFLGIPLVTMPLFAGLNSFTGVVSRASLVVSIVLLTSLVLVRFVLVVRGQEAIRAELAHQAHHDQLTGLANRPALRTVLDLSLSAPRDAYGPVLFYLDLNGFKQINDRYGHAAGDVVLVEFARRLTGVLRHGDVAARLGGDEFVVLSDCVETPAEAGAMAGRLQALTVAPVVMDGERLTVGVSIGVAAADDLEHPDVDGLLAAADADMYRQKTARRSLQDA